MLITKSHLDKFNPKENILFNNRSKKIALLICKAIDNDSHKNAVTVFLSHKHNEKDILEKVISLLESYNVDVYLDWQDEEMPVQTSGETASKIKKQILSNKKFILLATKAAIESKWCNWELGYGDAIKYFDHIAIMPIAENGGPWPGNEYLQIYPIIKTEYQYSTGSYYVEFNGKKTDLKEWLKKQ